MLLSVSDQIEFEMSLISEPTEQAYQSVINRAADNMPSKYIDNAYKAVYLKTGSFFAMNQYNDILKVKSFVKKDFVDLDSEWSSFFDKFLKTTRMTELISKAHLSTVKRLKSISKPIILETLSNGYSIRKTTKTILSKLGKEWNRTNRFNAARIARTEVVTASNAGGRLGAESTGLDMVHSWIDTKDGRERTSHVLAGVSKQNKLIPLKQDYVVGGERASFPGDPKLSGKERIQCRCAERFKVLL